MLLNNFLQKIQKNFIFFIAATFLLGFGLAFWFLEQQKVGLSVMEKSKEFEEARQNTSSGIFVDVSGAVLKPGVYKVDSFSRVGDALGEAGGITSEASILFVSRNLNLAQKLEDSQKIYIPFEWDTYQPEKIELGTLVFNAASSGSQAISLQPSPSVSKSGSGSSGSNVNSSNLNTKTNINSASLSDLDKLPGIGPAYAQRIIDNRTYRDFTEFSTKSKVPKATADALKNLISY